MEYAPYVLLALVLFYLAFVLAIPMLFRAPVGTKATMDDPALMAGAHALTARAIGRASISHTVVRACPRCRAPGLWSSEPRILDGWPGCYVPPGDARAETPVGDRCPHCAAPRARNLTEPRGVVWRGFV